MSQSNSDPMHSGLVELVVQGPDAATEIFLIDASLKRIAADVGALQTYVEPGLYKLRYRAGTSQHDSLVEVPAGVTQHFVDAMPVAFSASAPISDTRTTHEYQAGPAFEHSRVTHLAAGTGSHVYVFVREVLETEAWAGCDVALYTLDGQRVAGLEAGFNDAGARVSALNVQVDPATYALRVRDAGLGEYEMYVTASPDWQTQVFFTFEDFWRQGARIRAPSIRQASLMMAPPNLGFEPGGPHTRLSELARQALVQGRDVISGAILQDILNAKFEDPVLGLIGAHLLLARKRRDLSLLEIVLQNLRQMLGEHPDLDALEVAIERRGTTRVQSLLAPPTLRHGWNEVAQATRRRASLVPADSVLAGIAQNVVVAGPWLTSRVRDTRSGVRTDATIAGAVRLAGTLLAQDPDRLIGIEADARRTGNLLSGVEQTVLQSALSIVQNRSRLEGLSTGAGAQPAEEQQLISGISAPAYVVASAVASLSSRLESSG